MNLKDLAQQVQSAINALRAKREALNNECAMLESERETLLSAPLNRDDSRSLLLAYMDARAAEWLSACQWPAVFEEITYPNRYPGAHHAARPGIGKTAPMSLRDFDAIASGDRSATATIVGEGFALVGGKSGFLRLCDGALFALFGDQLKPKMVELFDRFYTPPLPEDAKQIGPPIAERRARLEVIAARLEEIRAAVAEIDTERRQISAPG